MNLLPPLCPVSSTLFTLPGPRILNFKVNTISKIYWSIPGNRGSFKIKISNKSVTISCHLFLILFWHVPTGATFKYLHLLPGTCLHVSTTTYLYKQTGTKYLWVQVCTGTSTYGYKYLQVHVPTGTSTYRYKHLQVQAPTGTSTHKYKHPQVQAPTGTSNYR